MAKTERRPHLSTEALERLLSVTRGLARSLDLQDLLHEVIEAARSVLHADRGTVFLYEPSTHELVSSVATGSGELRLSADRGIVGECARAREVILVPDCYADPRFNPEVDRATGYRTRCLMAVPLIGHDDVLEGVLQVLNKHEGVFTEDDEPIATALAAQCAVALHRVRLLDELMKKQRMEQELQVAQRIQKRVLPKTMPRVDGYDLFGWSRPADETGGDIYDVIERNDGVILLLGDATGHGIGPALSVTQVRAMLRMCVLLGTGIDDAIRHINNQLEADLSSRRMVTAFLGLLDTQQHQVTYHSAGQGPMLHYHAAEDRAEWLDSSARPLGIFGDDFPWPDSLSMSLDPGDLLVVVSDGIFEAEDPSEEQYGEDRMLEVVRRGRGRAPVAELVESIVASVESFSRGVPQADDMTILAVRRHSGD